VVWVETEGNQAANAGRFQKLAIPADQVLYPRVRGGDFRLESSDDMERLSETVAAVEPDLVVVDSLSGGLSAGDNSPATAKAFRELRKLAKTFQTCVLVVHHARKRAASGRSAEYGTDDARGTSTLAQHARSMLYLDEPNPAGDPGHIRVRHRKSNFGLKQPDFGMRIRKGRPVFSANPPVAPSGESMSARARELLPKWLRSGRKSVAFIKRKCREARISFEITKKVKKPLGIKSVKREGRGYWVLPE
jgi:hypothetical protein